MTQMHTDKNGYEGCVLGRGGVNGHEKHKEAQKEEGLENILGVGADLLVF